MNPPPLCPECGSANPAVQHRSDGLVSFRCDVCKHVWDMPLPVRADTSVPPLPAIDPSGG